MTNQYAFRFVRKSWFDGRLDDVMVSGHAQVILDRINRNNHSIKHDENIRLAALDEVTTNISIEWRGGADMMGEVGASQEYIAHGFRYQQSAVNLYRSAVLSGFSTSELDTMLLCGGMEPERLTELKAAVADLTSEKFPLTDLIDHNEIDKNLAALAERNSASLAQKIASGSSATEVKEAAAGNPMRGFKGGLGAFGNAVQIASLPVKIVADYKDAVRKVQPLIENHTLTAEAGHDYADVAVKINLMQTLSMGIDPAVGYPLFNEWVKKYSVSHEIREQLDPTGVSKRIQDFAPDT